MSAPQGYSRAQIWLHWIVAALIAAQYVFKDSIARAWEATTSGLPVEFSPLVAAHVFGGILILALVVWRLVLRFTRGAPNPPEQEHPALKTIARVAHWALYALIVLLSVSGLLAWFGGVLPAAGVHSILKTALLALIGLHVVAALFHQFVLKTDLMSRMKRAA